MKGTLTPTDRVRVPLMPGGLELAVPPSRCIGAPGLGVAVAYGAAAVLTTRVGGRCFGGGADMTNGPWFLFPVAFLPFAMR